MGRRDGFFRNGRNYQGGDDIEYYEDTHNEKGEYTGKKQETELDFSFSQSPTMKRSEGMPLPNQSDYMIRT